MKFLCTGDLHLGAGPDLGRVPGERLAEQAAVWRAIADLAISEWVDGVLLAGDMWERRRPTPAELLAFSIPIEQLRDEGIPTYAIAGNHDIEAREAPSALEVFGAQVCVFRQPQVYSIPGATLAVLPWTPPQALAADCDRWWPDVNSAAVDVLLDIARGLRSACPAGKPAILMLHWAVSGAVLPGGSELDPTIFREPIIPATELDALGFDAIVCGHLHRPWAWPGQLVGFVGSPLPINFGEAEDPHTVTILELKTQGAATFVPIPSRRLMTIDFGDVSETDDLLTYAGAVDLREAIVRLRYRATPEVARRIDHGALRCTLLDAGAHHVYAIQPEIIRSDRMRVEGLDETVGELDALRAWIDTQGSRAAPVFAELPERLAGYLAELG